MFCNKRLTTSHDQLTTRTLHKLHCRTLPPVATSRRQAVVQALQAPVGRWMGTGGLLGHLPWGHGPKTSKPENTASPHGVSPPGPRRGHTKARPLTRTYTAPVASDGSNSSSRGSAPRQDVTTVCACAKGNDPFGVTLIFITTSSQTRQPSSCSTLGPTTIPAPFRRHALVGARYVPWSLQGAHAPLDSCMLRNSTQQGRPVFVHVGAS